MKLAIRALLAIVFLLSAALKIISLDNFELFVFKTFPLNWLYSTILSRLLIALEIAIGLMYLSGIALKKVNWIALSIIVAFSVWLLTQWIGGSEENCHCMGDVIEMGPAESLLKNLFILVLIIILARLKGPDKMVVPARFKTLSILCVLIISIATPVVLSPPDFLVENRYSLEGVSTQLDYKQLEKTPWTEGSMDLEEGKVILIFASMKCEICQKTGHKLDIINIRNGNKLKMAYMFFGEVKNMPSFWEKAQSAKYPYKIIPPELFFKITKQLPTVFLINNGKVIKAMGYRSVTDEVIDEFLNKD